MNPLPSSLTNPLRNSLTSSPVSGVLEHLFREAEAADGALKTELTDDSGSFNETFKELIEAEARDYKGMYHRFADNYLSVSPEFGRFLYMLARSAHARRIVEFGTSFGVSTIHLAAAVRDNGGGTVISTELEPGKAAQARRNLEAAGLADLVDIRVGDALETLRENAGDVEAGREGDGREGREDDGHEGDGHEGDGRDGAAGTADVAIDLVLLDGAMSLYLPVLELLEPHLRPGALVIAENAMEESTAYLDHIRHPQGGYLSLSLPFDEGRGNQLSLWAG